jgi:hypothetical protein
VTVTVDLPDLLPASCTSWCTLHHGPGLLTAHGRTVALIEAPHVEVSVQVEQAGEHAPVLALSVDAFNPAPGAAGFTHLGAAQARELRDALIAAVDLLNTSHPTSGTASG